MGQESPLLLYLHGGYSGASSAAVDKYWQYTAEGAENTRWAEISVASSPALYRHSFVRAGLDGTKFFLYGGADASDTATDQAYLLSSTDITLLTPTNSVPGARMDAMMWPLLTPPPGGDGFLFAGGTVGPTNYWDLTTMHEAQVDSGEVTYVEHTMTHDFGGNNMMNSRMNAAYWSLGGFHFMYGGIAQYPDPDDFRRYFDYTETMQQHFGGILYFAEGDWEWILFVDYPGIWDPQYTHPQHPGSRYGMALGYVPGMVAFYGGRNDQGPGFSDLWLWDASMMEDFMDEGLMWAKIEEQSTASDAATYTGDLHPGSRYGARLAINPVDVSVWVFGGMDENTQTKGDLWSVTTGYTPTTGPDAPPSTSHHEASYLADHGSTWAHHVFDNAQKGTYYPNGEAAACSDICYPGSRAHAVFFHVTDSDPSRFVLYGGVSSSTYYDEIWTYTRDAGLAEHQRWLLKGTTGEPLARMSYCDRATTGSSQYVFGGGPSLDMTEHTPNVRVVDGVPDVPTVTVLPVSSGTPPMIRRGSSVWQGSSGSRLFITGGEYLTTKFPFKPCVSLLLDLGCQDFATQTGSFQGGSINQASPAWIFF